MLLQGSDIIFPSPFFRRNTVTFCEWSMRQQDIQRSRQAIAGICHNHRDIFPYIIKQFTANNPSRISNHHNSSGRLRILLTQMGDYGIRLHLIHQSRYGKRFRLHRNSLFLKSIMKTPIKVFSPRQIEINRV